MKPQSEFKIYWTIFGIGIVVAFIAYTILIEFDWYGFLTNTRIWLIGILAIVPISMLIAHKVKV